MTGFPKGKPAGAGRGLARADNSVGIAIASIASEPIQVILALPNGSYGLPRSTVVYEMDEAGRRRLGTLRKLAPQSNSHSPLALPASWNWCRRRADESHARVQRREGAVQLGCMVSGVAAWRPGVKPNLTGGSSGHLQLAHDEGREFLVQMRRDAGFEPGGLAVVIPLDDLADLVQPRDDARIARAARTTP